MTNQERTLSLSGLKTGSEVLMLDVELRSDAIDALMETGMTEQQAVANVDSWQVIDGPQQEYATLSDDERMGVFDAEYRG
jgi:hypothetical protein